MGCATILTLPLPIICCCQPCEVLPCIVLHKGNEHLGTLVSEWQDCCAHQSCGIMCACQSCGVMCAGQPFLPVGAPTPSFYHVQPPTLAHARAQRLFAPCKQAKPGLHLCIDACSYLCRIE